MNMNNLKTYIIGEYTVNFFTNEDGEKDVQIILGEKSHNQINKEILVNFIIENPFKGLSFMKLFKDCKSVYASYYEAVLKSMFILHPETIKPFWLSRFEFCSSTNFAPYLANFISIDKCFSIKSLDEYLKKFQTQKDWTDKALTALKSLPKLYDVRLNAQVVDKNTTYYNGTCLKIDSFDGIIEFSYVDLTETIQKIKEKIKTLESL